VGYKFEDNIVPPSSGSTCTAPRSEHRTTQAAEAIYDHWIPRRWDWCSRRAPTRWIPSRHRNTCFSGVVAPQRVALGFIG